MPVDQGEIIMFKPKYTVDQKRTINFLNQLDVLEKILGLESSPIIKERQNGLLKLYRTINRKETYKNDR